MKEGSKNDLYIIFFTQVLMSPYYVLALVSHLDTFLFFYDMMMMMIFYSSLVTLLSNMQCTMKHEKET